MGGILQRQRELRQRRHRKKKLKVFKRRLALDVCRHAGIGLIRGSALIQAVKHAGFNLRKLRIVHDLILPASELRGAAAGGEIVQCLGRRKVAAGWKPDPTVSATAGRDQ